MTLVLASPLCWRLTVPKSETWVLVAFRGQPVRAVWRHSEFEGREACAVS